MSSPLDPTLLDLFAVLTIIVLLFKLNLIIIFLILLRKRKKSVGFIEYDFLYALFVLICCLFLSRLSAFYFDIVLTKFDYNLYYIYPNYIYWKLGMMFGGLGLVYVAFIIDKKYLDFKFKGIVEVILIMGVIFTSFYPINNKDDYSTLSLIYMFTLLPFFIIGSLFFYIGVKTPTFRSASFLVLIGGSLFGVSSLIMSEGIIIIFVEIYGPETRIFLLYIWIGFKILGLSFVVFGLRKFILYKSTDLMTEFYKNKKICVIHKGKIIDKIYFCPNCYAKYCKKCYINVILEENKCWVCEYEFSKEESPETTTLKDVTINIEDTEETHKKILPKKG